MSKKFVKILNFSSFLIILFIIFMLIKLLGNSFIFRDDIHIKFISGIKTFIIQPHNADYISNFLCSLFGLYLPIKMHIHPADFKSIYFTYIEVCLILLYPVILYKIFMCDLPKRLKVFSCFIFLFIVMVFLFIALLFENFLFIYETLFRMFMPILYWLGLLYLLSKDNQSYKDYILMNIMGFMCCLSNEMIVISTIAGCICYFIIQVIKKEIKEVKRLIILFVYMLLGLVLYIKIGGFFRHNTAQEMINIDYIISVIKEIPEFSVCYFKEIFIKYIGFYIIIVLSLIGIYTLPKNNEKDRKVILSLSFLFGILVFFYLLVFMKKSHYIPNQYWLIHWDLHYMFNIMLLGIVLILFSNLIKYSKVQWNKFVASLLLIVIGFFSGNFILYKNLYDDMKKIKTYMYKLEKTLRLACYKNKIAVVENNIEDYHNSWWLYHFYKLHLGKGGLNDFDAIQPVEFINRFDTEHYLKGKFVLGNNEEAEMAFKENGGYYTEKELKELHFTNLLDDNFVLGISREATKN